MTLREVVLKAMDFVGTVDVSTDNPDGNKLISSARFVCTECADRYSDIRDYFTAHTVDGSILFSGFPHDVKTVLSVKKDDKNVPFSVSPTGIFVKQPGTYVIEYRYFSTIGGLDETMNVPKNFGLDTLAIGAAAEYFFRNGFSEESIVYKNRYDNAVKNDLRTIKAGRLPIRRFV